MCEAAEVTTHYNLNKKHAKYYYIRQGKVTYSTVSVCPSTPHIAPSANQSNNDAVSTRLRIFNLFRAVDLVLESPRSSVVHLASCPHSSQSSISTPHRRLLALPCLPFQSIPFFSLSNLIMATMNGTPFLEIDEETLNSGAEGYE
jgi:hypothetical protein